MSGGGGRSWLERIAAAVRLLSLIILLSLPSGLYDGQVMAEGTNEQVSNDWVAEIEKVFIRSEECKQCHERHYEEWKGVREQTPDLKTFGRVDAALLHGTSLTSPVFGKRRILPQMSSADACRAMHLP